MSPRLVFGVLIAVVGVLFLLDNLGVLNSGFLGSWWPAGLIVLGAVQLVFGDHTAPRVIGMGVVLLGGLLLLGNLQPEVLDVAEELFKSGKLTDIQVVELENTGHIYDKEPRGVLEREIKRRYS